MPPRRSTKPTTTSTTDYRHDETRLNNPPAGLADVAPLPLAGRKRYAYDPRLDPQLVWAGKAEHVSFDVETVPLHIHERVAPAAIVDSLRSGPVQASMFALQRSHHQLASVPAPGRHRHAQRRPARAGERCSLRKVWPTTRSHVSHVVRESGWEKRAAQILESHRNVINYVRNYKLDFTIPYRFAETNHQYVPDFILVLAKDLSDPARPRLNLVLEIKGEEDERDRAKAAGADRWKDAVNYAGTFGRWEYQVCRNVDSLRTLIDVVATRVG